MTGTHKITIQNKRVHYQFEVHRNITIIKGDSATGKTTLVEMIEEYMNEGANSRITLSCDKKCNVIAGNTWQGQLSEITDSIVFVDEGNSFVYTDEFARVIKNTDNYYVIVSREGLPNLPYSVEEVYGIKHSGKYGSLEQSYNEFYQIYSVENQSTEDYPCMIVTEDSNSGFQFYTHLCKNKDIECMTADGKSNIISILSDNIDKEKILVVADGAAFGAEMDRIIKLEDIQGNFKLFLPESFEWLLLSSGLFKEKEIRNILDTPGDYIESKDYFSWERFFTDVLTKHTKDTFLNYNKSKLNEAYLNDKCIKYVSDIIF